MMRVPRNAGQTDGQNLKQEVGVEILKMASEHLLKLDVTGIASSALGAFHQKKKDDLIYFLRELARQAEDEGIDFQSEFETRFFPKNGTSEVITQAIKATLEITDSRILAALARLVFHYEINGRPVDLLYRGLVRLLESIGGPELEVLGRIVHASQQLRDAKPEQVDAAIVVEQQRQAPFRIKVELVGGYVTYIDGPLSPGLVSLLIANAVVNQPSYGRLDARGDFIMSRSVCELMTNLFAYPVNQ